MCYTLSLLLSILFIITSCKKENNNIYIKYVYTQPSNVKPFNSVNDVDIWFSRLKFRGLTRTNESGIVEMDLAKSITTKDFKTFDVVLSDNFFANNKKIDSKVVADALNEVKNNYPGELGKNIEYIHSISKNRLSISLKIKNPFFRNALASHIFLIFDTTNLENPSGLYKLNSKKEYVRITSDKQYPKKVLPVIPELNNNYVYEFYDSALLPLGSFSSKHEFLKYQLFETYGLVLNLKNKFRDIKTRKCLNDKIDRNRLLESYSEKHKSIYNLKGEVLKGNSCSNKLSFKLDIPKELGDTSSKICRSFKDNFDVSCNVITFTKLLKNLKGGDFDVSLLNLTIDLPYIESITEYLNYKNHFSIINTPVDIPKQLVQAEGQKYIDELSKFLYDKYFFIALSRPIKKVYGSNISNYIPSLLSAGYDSIENLKR